MPRLSFSVGRAVVAVVATGAILVGILPASAPTRLLAISPTATSVRFTASGDFSASPAAQSVFSAIGAINPDLHLALGDLSYGTTGQEQAWCDLVTSRVGAGFPFELIAGNHESNGLNGNINNFSACLPNQLPGVVGTYGRQYYVDVPADAPLVRYVMVSPAIPFEDGNWSYASGTPRLAWTAAAIDGARAANIPWVVVGMHKPCINVGSYSCEIGAGLLDLLVDKRVDVVLSGHEHIYQRTHQLAVGPGCSAVVAGAYNASCVADADSSMVKGAGVVFATVGTGGVPFRDFNPTDSELPYVAAVSALNANPTFGSLDVSVTSTSLSANFARASGGTFADVFTITKAEIGTNQPPIANYSASCTQLSCGFDASAASDPEAGPLVYSWSFGDGGTGVGITPTHTYAAAGVYSTVLTVTDAAGATATRSIPVTAQAPATGQIAADDFERAVASGWGVAPIGGPWAITGTASRFGVSGGTASMISPAGVTQSAHLNGVSSSSTDVVATYALDKLPVGGSYYLSVAARKVPGAGAYQSKIVITSAGKVTMSLTRVNASGGSEVIVQPAVVAGVTYVAGTKLAVRVRTTGMNPTTIQTRVWIAGTAEPSVWLRAAVDSTAVLQSAGGIGATAYVSGGATNAPFTLRVDDLVAVAP